MTHPKGSFFVPLNPISVTLGISNASFVAQTVDWNPPHLYETIRAGHEHQGLSFIRIFQRCPHYTPQVYAEPQKDPSLVLMMKHPEGINLPEAAEKVFPNRVEHDPSDLATARELADERSGMLPIGLFYRNRNAERYDQVTAEGLGVSRSEKVEAVKRALDRFLV